MQLPLQLTLRDDATFDNFFSGPNQELIEVLQRNLIAGDDKQAHIWGPQGSGRSHILQACCHYAETNNLTAIYLPLKESQQYEVALLDDLDHFDLICLDDVDEVAHLSVWEEALFRLYNAVRDKQGFFLTSARMSARELPFDLADLKSRFSWGLILQLEKLSDMEKKQVLCFRAEQRGITLPEEVASFILKTYSREMHDLFTVLDALDRASLIQQRVVTIPFVKEVLHDLQQFSQVV